LPFFSEGFEGDEKEEDEEGKTTAGERPVRQQ
jgi:hypothetical protein